MRHSEICAPRQWWQCRCLVPAVALLLLAGPAVCADDRVLTAVEEDWVALIRSPDATTSTPQIVNVISPTESTSGAFALFEVNHNSYPAFREGGIQGQAFQGAELSGAATSQTHPQLDCSYDRLEYTVGLRKHEGRLLASFRNARSRAWGHLFDDTVITVVLPGTSTSLAGYRPEFSVAGTNVNVGAHRVEILYQRETRYLYSDGTVTVDGTLRVIHRFRDLVQDVSLEEYDRNPDYYNIAINE